MLCTAQVELRPLLLDVNKESSQESPVVVLRPLQLLRNTLPFSQRHPAPPRPAPYSTRTVLRSFGAWDSTKVPTEVEIKTFLITTVLLCMLLSTL